MFEYGMSKKGKMRGEKKQRIWGNSHSRNKFSFRSMLNKKHSLNFMPIYYFMLATTAASDVMKGIEINANQTKVIIIMKKRL